jgi:hypothetical protein
VDAGSEVFVAVKNSRRGVGIELKPSYYRQAKRNVVAALNVETQIDLLSTLESTPEPELQEVE